MKYIVIEGNHLKDFEATVAGSLDAGWQLQGGVSVTNFIEEDGVVSTWYYQAMIRDDD